MTRKSCGCLKRGEQRKLTSGQEKMKKTTSAPKSDSLSTKTRDLKRQELKVQIEAWLANPNNKIKKIPVGESKVEGQPPTFRGDSVFRGKK